MWKPKKYKYILWDIDDTLIDFKKSEKAALRQCFQTYGIELSDEDIMAYSKINHQYWHSLEKGEVEKQYLLVQRFHDFGQYLDKTLDAVAINDAYQLALGQHAVMYEYGYDLCKEIQGQCYQCAVTNGTEVAQIKKLTLTGLLPLFDDIFISDVVGYEKPNILFFDHCFANIKDFKKEEAIIIGDSLTSDIQGANNAGIACCYFDHNRVEVDGSLRIDYIIHDLSELRNIL